MRTKTLSSANRLALLLIAVLSAAAPFHASDTLARPAAKYPATIYQPDGSPVQAIMKGDEFIKILTTTDGCAIGQDNEGWYCYAYYDNKGYKRLTEFKVGQDVPAEIKSKSRIIPYPSLNNAAAVKKAAARQDRENILLRTRASKGVSTRTGNTPVNKHGIVILAQFSDLEFQPEHTRDAFVRMLTEPGYDYNGATGSAIDYFNAQFEGQFTFTFDISQIVTLSKGYAQYGANDRNGDDIDAAGMILEACRLADKEIDFSKYDDDLDGEVDNVFVFFAGGDEAEYAGDDHVWSHAWYLIDGAGKQEQEVTFDGVKVNRYACTAELHRLRYENRYVLSGIGTFCHEFSHTLGLSDYYDTDYESSNGIADAMWGSTALMDSGNQNNEGNTPPNFNAVDRDELGLSEAVILSPGTHTLEPIDESGIYYKMETGNRNEYFLFECRREDGWDRYIGGSGLLIYHIDKSFNSAGFSETYNMNLSASDRWKYNEINCNPAHQCADLVEAWPMAGNVSQVFFPYTTTSVSRSSFTPLTDPAFVFWNGTASSLAINEISRDGDNIIISVGEFTGEISAPHNVMYEAFQDAAIITWEWDGQPGMQEMTLRWKESAAGDEEFEEILIDSPYKGNCYSHTLEGLSPRTSYNVRITVRDENGVESDAATCNFMTKSPKSRHYPFIYLHNVMKNSDGTYPAGSRFPLRLFNAYDAVEIIWSMDGKVIQTDGSGYYTPDNSGEMKAEIYYEDGSKAVVTKKIIIK